MPNKDESLIHIPSLILNSSVEGDKPFVDFQTEPTAPSEVERSKRHYFESVVITPGVNRNMFEVTPEAMIMAMKGYKSGKPLSINHDKGYWTNTLGYGMTVDAVIVDGKLYVASYLALEKTYPQGPLGTSEELRDGIVDGYIGNVSQSLTPIKARCSVDGLPYPFTLSDYEMDGVCQHYRGENVIVEENNRKVIKTVHIIIEKCEAQELSLVMLPADEGSGINRPTINFSINDFVDTERMIFLSKPEDGSDGEDPENGEPVEPTPAIEPEGDTIVSITQEQFNAVQQRATTAETQIANLTVEASTAKAESVRLEGEVKTVEAEKKTTEAEKATLQAKLDAEEAKVLKLEAEAAIAKKQQMHRIRKLRNLKPKPKRM